MFPQLSRFAFAIFAIEAFGTRADKNMPAEGEHGRHFEKPKEIDHDSTEFQGDSDWRTPKPSPTPKPNFYMIGGTFVPAPPERSSKPPVGFPTPTINELDSESPNMVPTLAPTSKDGSVQPAQPTARQPSLPSEPYTSSPVPDNGAPTSNAPDTSRPPTSDSLEPPTMGSPTSAGSPTTDAQDPSRHPTTGISDGSGPTTDTPANDGKSTSTPATSPAPLPDEEMPTDSLPSDSITPGPTNDGATRCETNSDGWFGNIDHEFAYEPVPYNYEIEIIPAISSDLKGSILPALEKAIADRILPSLSIPKCNSGRLLRRELTLVGISVNPPDQALDGVGCLTNLAEETNSCSTIDGELTIYIDRNAVARKSSEETSQVRSLIQQHMNKGDFDNAHDAIARVTYRNLEPDLVDTIDQDGNAGSGPGDGPGSVGNNSGGVGTPVYAAIAAGAIIFVAAAVYIRKRQRRELDNASDLSPNN